MSARHQDLLDRYCRYVGLTRSGSTVACHRAKLRPLLITGPWKDLASEGFTRQLFEDYVAYGKDEKKWKPRTLQILIDVCKSFIRWCGENDIPCPDFVGNMKKPRVHLGKVIFYSEDEIKRLLDAGRNTRLAVLVALGAYAGMRKTEIWNAHWEDVDWDERVLTIRGTKVGRDREMPMNDTLWRGLRSFWRNQKQGRIFEGWDWYKINAYRDLKRLAARAGVEFKGIHALRRSFATHLLGKGADVATTKALGGWTSLATVSRYAGTTGERQRAAVDLLG